MTRIQRLLCLVLQVEKMVTLSYSSIKGAHCIVRQVPDVWTLLLLLFVHGLVEQFDDIFCTAPCCLCVR